MARIFSISYDESLLSTRRWMLESLGHQVTSALGFTAALHLCVEESFDFVIIGHSIPHDDKKAIVREIRRHCNAPILTLLKHMEPQLEEADYYMDFSHPEQFLDFVKEVLLDRPSAKRA
jgi:DNA-binding response OmpR family regulator